MLWCSRIVTHRYCRQQNHHPQHIPGDVTREQIEKREQESSKALVAAQLTFEKANECERKLAEKDSHRRYKKLKDSFDRQSGHHSTALVKREPVQNFVADITKFPETAITRPQHDSGDESDGSGEHKYETALWINRRQELEMHAAAAVRRLCIRWTNVNDGNDGKTPHDLPHGSSTNVDQESNSDRFAPGKKDLQHDDHSSTKPEKLDPNTETANSKKYRISSPSCVERVARRILAFLKTILLKNNSSNSNYATRCGNHRERGVPDMRARKSSTSYRYPTRRGRKPRS